MVAWVSDAEALAYFATRINATSWSPSGTNTTALLTTAQWQIENSGLFADYPNGSNASGEALVQEQKDAVCEQALFLLKESVSVEARTSLQDQGVEAASLLGESYKKGGKPVVICRTAVAAMTTAGYAKYGKGFRFV